MSGKTHYSLTSTRKLLRIRPAPATRRVNLGVDGGWAWEGRRYVTRKQSDGEERREERRGVVSRVKKREREGEKKKRRDEKKSIVYAVCLVYNKGRSSSSS